MEKVIIEIIAEKIITKKVGTHGKKARCGRIYVPKTWVDSEVIIIKGRKKTNEI